jgi:tRNA (guanine-N7-)-methyltransferase
MSPESLEEAAPSRSASLIFQPSIVVPLAFDTLFPARQPVEIELGSGDGSFLAEYASLHPERNFLGVERLLGRLRKVDRKALRRALTNLRLVRLEAAYLAAYLLPPASISVVHVYFPDPWPKRKHRKNRLINAEFAGAAAKALAAGGAVYLRTDDEDYFAQMKEVFAAQPGFQEIETPEELARVVTDFERGFHARNIATRRAAYQIKEDSMFAGAVLRSERAGSKAAEPP